MDQQQLIEMSGGDFAEWAEQTYGVDYDNVSFWDMQRNLDSKKQMPEGFEVGDTNSIPAELYDLLIARKAYRNPAIVARDEARVQGEQEARTIVTKPEPWSREDWKRLTELQYAMRYTDDGGEQGYISTSYSLTERGERLLNPDFRSRGLYDDQVGIDG